MFNSRNYSRTYDAEPEITYGALVFDRSDGHMQALFEQMTYIPKGKYSNQSSKQKKRK